MLNTTFKTYTSGFKALMTIFRPLIVVQLLVLILMILLNMFFDEKRWLLVVVFSVFAIFVSIVQSLIYSPAVFRTIQKRELGETAIVEVGIAFQKKNIGNYFVFMFWLTVYSMYYSLQSILSVWVGIMLALFAGTLGFVGKGFGILLGLVGAYYAILLAYKNIPKLLFALNIYFDRNLSPRENIVESINLGITKRNVIWTYIVGFFSINIVGLFLMKAPLFFNMDVLLEKVKPTFMFDTITTVWAALVSLFFILPMTYIYLSKTYAKIRTTSEIPKNGESVVTAEII